MSVVSHSAPPASREEQIGRVLDSLVAERQRLRASGSDQALLEANRLAIVYWQNALVREIGESRRPR